MTPLSDPRLPRVRPESNGSQSSLSGIMVANLDQQRAMIAMLSPLVVGADLDATDVFHPSLRDEAIVDVERILLMPLKVVGRSGFPALHLSVERVVRTDQSESCQLPDEGGVTPLVLVRSVPNSVGVQVPHQYGR